MESPLYVGVVLSLDDGIDLVFEMIALVFPFYIIAAIGYTHKNHN